MTSARPFLLALVSLLTAAAVQPSAAQPASVTGIVIDDRTEIPIGNVLVFTDGHPVFTTTDDEGRFAMALAPGEYSIAASIVGYALLRAPVTVTAGVVVPVTFRLSEGAGTFSERVTVTGSRLAESETAPGAGALFGRELENLRGVMLDDPLRAVQALPAATATDDLYSEFAVRGSSFDHVGLTVDGIGTRYLMHTVHGVTDGGSIAMVNSEALGAVALLPGSYPQTTGRALGAQVDLVTREGNREQFRARAGLSGTSATVLGEGPLPGGRGSWLASARKSYLGYIIRRIEPDASFVFGFVDAQAKIAYDVSGRHQLSLTTLIGRAAFDEGEEDLGANDRAEATSHAWLSALAWRYIPGPRLAVTHRFYSTGVEYDQVNAAGTTLDAARAHDTGWRMDATFAPAGSWLIAFGGDAQRLQGRSLRQRTLSTGPRRLNEYDEHAGSGTAYAQMTLPIGRLRLSPGVRGDAWGLTDERTLSPWLTATVDVSNRLRLRGGSGLYRQFPTIEQVHGLRRSDVRHERATHLDAGIEYDLRRQTRGSVTVYRRRERDVLRAAESEPQRLANGTLRPGFADSPWVNRLDGRATGFELLLRRDSPSGLSGWAGYGYSRSRYSDAISGERFWADADQRHTVTLYGNLRLSSRSTVSAKFRSGSNYPLRGYLVDGDAPEIDGRPAYYLLGTERNTLRLPAYARLDVRADRAFHLRGTRLVLFVEVANALSRDNRRNTPYGNDRSGRVFGATESLIPIVPSAGFVVDF